MDNVDLNNSPDLTMAEITKQLLNNAFMSDMQFLVEDKLLFAHSWELMKRSTVFREELSGTALGDNKPIPIDDVTYEVFYQFLRFIYTDECNIKKEMICEMLKLAVRYKIVKLENKVLNLERNNATTLILFEFNLDQNYQLNRKCVFDEIIGFLGDMVKEKTFLTINSNVMKEILKSEYIPCRITEIELFNHLVRWMNNSCKLNGIPLCQRRLLFDELLRLIRFPLMSSDEFKLCTKKNPDLFTDEDNSTICRQIVSKGLGGNFNWIEKPRLKCVYPWMWKKTATNEKWLTKFTVAADLIIYGLTFGSGVCDFAIEISGINPETSYVVKLIFNFEDSRTCLNTISLGETIKLKPHVDYTIKIKYKNQPKDVFCRKCGVELTLIEPITADLITFTEISQNLSEIFLKLPNN